MLKTKKLIVKPAVLLAVCLSCSAWGADPPQQPATSGATVPPAASTKAPATTPDAKAHRKSSIYKPDRFAGRAGKYYELNWGIDSISVKLVESGELVRFSYRVLDADKARVLNEKENVASLIDPKAGVSLVVPTLEKVGQLRQSAPPAAGRVYWMAFSNKGRRVARGDRVDVVIGQFKASNLVVD
jgi:hypothetical protein